MTALKRRRRQAEQQPRPDKDAQPAGVEPAAQALLALQRSAGNAAASRMLARSPLKPPGPVGEVTASIGMIGYESTEQASAVRELTVGPAATFEGFESEQEAAVAATGSESVGVVVADGEGRFHAYETDLEPVWGPIFSHVTPLELPNARVVRWTHLETFGGAATLEEQMRFAERLVRAGGMEEQARRVYLGVLRTAVGLDASELHDATGGTAAPGKVSFDLEYTAANAHAGITGKLPEDRATELPEPTLVVGPGSFTTFPALRATVLHEFTHLNHAKLAIAAVRRWRAETTSGTFRAWLNRELKAGRIDAIDHAVILDEVKGETENTEALSYLVSFIASYDLTDVAAMPAGDDVIDGFLFAKLGQLAGEWVKADHVVEEHVLDRLLAYRDTLDEVRRERLQQYAARRYEANDAKSAFRLFWGPLR